MNVSLMVLLTKIGHWKMEKFIFNTICLPVTNAVEYVAPMLVYFV